MTKGTLNLKCSWTQNYKSPNDKNSNKIDETDDDDDDDDDDEVDDEYFISRSPDKDFQYFVN